MADAPGPDQNPFEPGPDAAPHSEHLHHTLSNDQIIPLASAQPQASGAARRPASSGHQHHSWHSHKVKLLGRVGEEEACSLITDRSRIVVGSGLGCDLILSDPLVPARAFMLRHVKEHGDLNHSCGSCWQLEVFPGARVFLNRHIAKQELIHFGDTITVGCHLLFFLQDESSVLNRRLQVEVQGICRDLISAEATPTGYLHSLPSWRDGLRNRAALRWGGGVAAALLLAILFVPRPAEREYVPDAMTVVIVPDGSASLDVDSKPVISRNGKRPVNSVARHIVAVPEQPTETPELTDFAPPASESAVMPILNEPAAEKAAPQLKERVVADAGSLGESAAPLGVAEGAPALQITREKIPLTTGSLAARQTLAETGPEVAPREMALLSPAVVSREPPALAMGSISNLNSGPASLDRVTSEIGTLSAPVPVDPKVATSVTVPRVAPALARGTSGARQTREENVALAASGGTLQSLQPSAMGAGGSDPHAIALTDTAPAAPGAAPGGRLMQDVGSLGGSDTFVVKVGPTAAMGRVAQKLERGGGIQRQSTAEAIALATPGAGPGSGDGLQTLLPQAGAGGSQTIAMAVSPGVKLGVASLGRIANDAGAVGDGGTGSGSIVNAGPQAAVGRGSQKLARGASGPRQTQTETIAAYGVPGGVMQGYTPRLDGKGAQVHITSATGRIAHVASTGKLETNRNAVVGAMHMNASPLDFTQYRGHKIPIARIGVDQLSTMTIFDGTKGHILDGMISSSEEAAAGFRSLPFTVHGPGSPPPVAQPQTRYILGRKKDDKGRECLYIGFICDDPNPEKIVYTHTQGGPYTERDDSIELFLDTRNSRVSYNHLIVNTRAMSVAYFCPDAEKGINGQGTPWDHGAEIKTHIDHAGKKWTCEISIPFEKLGGAPPKGTKWPANFVRNFRGQGNPQEVLSSWYLVYENSTNYHRPNRFGLIEL